MRAFREERRLETLPDGRILAEYGPMRLLISAWIGKVIQPETAAVAAQEAFGYLERVAEWRALLSRPASGLPPRLADPLADRMLQNVRTVGDRDLTPMAAVAGTLADAVADDLMARGMTRVAVNNGGDVAVRLRRGESLRVGIRSSVERLDIARVVRLDDRRAYWGIATSGLGGRSLTRGVASAATVISSSASLADAAATAVANATRIRRPEVAQRPAEEVDPASDLAGIAVTTAVASLDPPAVQQALTLGMSRAESLIARGRILGALVVVQGRERMTDFIRDIMEPWATDDARAA